MQYRSLFPPTRMGSETGLELRLMPTHDYVAPTEIDQARHEQNMPKGVDTPVPKSWKVDRPGYDISPKVESDDDDLIGNPGPNVGYAYRLLAQVWDRIELVKGEHKHDVEPLLAEIAMRRASHFGRAPIPADIGFAIRVLSYAGTPDKGEEKWRPQLVNDCGHDLHRRRLIVNSIPIDVLQGGEEGVEHTISGWWEKLEGLFK